MNFFLTILENLIYEYEVKNIDRPDINSIFFEFKNELISKFNSLRKVFNEEENLTFMEKQFINLSNQFKTSLKNYCIKQEKNKQILHIPKIITCDSRLVENRKKTSVDLVEDIRKRFDSFYSRNKGITKSYLHSLATYEYINDYNHKLKTEVLIDKKTSP